MNNYKIMRAMIFFDLPVETNKQRKAYRRFVKTIKEEGFFMFQKSIYVKLGINEFAIKSSLNNVKGAIPEEGFVVCLKITERQFNDLDILLGTFKTDVVNSEERYIEV